MSSARVRFAPFLAALVLTATALRPQTARADAPASNNAALAEALFDEGRKLLAAGQYDEACVKFEGSQKLDPGVGTLLFLGECYERAERYASAWARFREAASVAAAARDARETVAKDRAAKLEAQIFKLTIAVSQPVDGLAVLLDGQPIPSASWGVALPADAGKHAIEARAPGFTTWTTKVELPKAAGQETVTVPALVPAPKEAPPPEVPVAPPASPPKQPPAPEAPGQGLLIGGIVVGGLGVVSLAVTGALVGVASSKYGDADAFCDGATCFDQQGIDLTDQARTFGDAATGLFIGGLVLAGVGVTMIILQPSSPEPASAALFLGTTPGGARIGVQGAF